jgi:signal transduction histidine kinase
MDSSPKNNNIILRNFLIVVVVLSWLLVVTGIFGIIVMAKSKESLKELEEFGIKPIVTMSEFSNEIRDLNFFIMRLNQKNISESDKQINLTSIQETLEKIDLKISEQIAVSKNKPYEKYFSLWAKDWKEINKSMKEKISSVEKLNPHIQKIDAEISELLYKLSNITDYIQYFVSKASKEQTDFNHKATVLLIGIFLLSSFCGISASVYFYFRLKQLLESIKVAEAQLVHTSRLASLGEMSAGVAHEINNPLTIIAGSLRLLNLVKNDNEKFEKKIIAMEKACGRITKIVMGLKKFSHQNERGNYKTHILSKIISESIELSQNKAKQFRTEIIFESKNESLIDCDEMEIEQILVNLIHNAIDAIKELDERWVKIEIIETETEVALRVHDSGKGIPLSVQAKMFDPFFTTKGVGSGTGLGLSISKGIIEQHKGSIEVINNLPNTCFEVKFPKSTAGALAA